MTDDYPESDAENVSAFFEELVDERRSPPGPDQLATLAALLTSPALRDLALVQWATDHETGAATLTAQGDHDLDESRAPAAGAMLLGAMPPPDLARMERALIVCERSASRAPGAREAAAAHAASAWLSWMLGRPDDARQHVDEAIAGGGTSTFILLVRGMLDAELAPGWMRGRR
ncbi:hypothetical protein [Microbacterium sp. PMB16]|uniref:hypothetical protein n=1 Tax=Microbacterium sp. PMB16 TaxID=3120157 RepID=UPI003F4B834E